MTQYEVIVAASASREIEDLPRSVARRVYERLEALASEPRPHGVKKLKGERELWRIRVGDYRVVYAIDDDTRTIDVVRARHRSKVYR
ncbi:MAG: type II toxin-antitoxin system RelE/ParE family toxin [Acidobacteria bacterium]|nr:type II toxin-antitoxin system RelE/ParE family toxin [Acidobacteriota bacterium]